MNATATATAPVTAPAKIGVKTAAKSVPPDSPVPSVPPAKAALDAIMRRVTATREKGIETALMVYRAHALKLADGGELSVPEAEALVHSLQVLNLKPEQFRADVDGILAHRAQVRFAASSQKIADDIAPQESGWAAELDRLQKRVNEIRGLQARMYAEGLQAARHEGEAQRLYGEHKRVLAPLSVALEDATTEPHSPRYLRSDGSVRDAFGAPVPVPALS